MSIERSLIRIVKREMRKQPPMSSIEPFELSIDGARTRSQECVTRIFDSEIRISKGLIAISARSIRISRATIAIQQPTM